MLLTAVLAALAVPVTALAEASDSEPLVASAPAPAAPSVSPAPAAPTAPPTATATLESTSDEQKAKKPWSVGVGISHGLNSGVFRGYKPGINGSLRVSPSYSFELAGVKLGVGAGVSGSYTYTLPNNSTARRYNWSDIGVDLSIPGFYTEKITGISFSANVGSFIPTTLDNWWQNVATGISGGISLSRKFGKFNVGGRFGASKTFFTSTDRKISPEVASVRDDAAHEIYICRVSQSGCLLRGGVPTLWSMSGGVNAGYSPIDKLSLSIGLSFGKRYKYYVGIDEFSPKTLTADGEPAVRAQGESDDMVGSLGVSYKLTPAIGVSLGMDTRQSPFRRDTGAFRFPFYAFTGKEDLRYTGYSLSFSGSY